MFTPFQQHTAPELQQLIKKINDAFDQCQRRYGPTTSPSNQQPLPSHLIEKLAQAGDLINKKHHGRHFKQQLAIISLLSHYGLIHGVDASQPDAQQRLDTRFMRGSCELHLISSHFISSHLISQSQQHLDVFSNESKQEIKQPSQQQTNLDDNLCVMEMGAGKAELSTVLAYFLDSNTDFMLVDRARFMHKVNIQAVVLSGFIRCLFSCVSSNKYIILT